jgi:arginyl-tRNA synthetase
MEEILPKTIKKALKKLKLDLELNQINSLIEIPPSKDLGDFAFPCFSFSKQLKMPPQEISIKLREEIGNPPKQFQDIQTAGPYINFFLDRKNLALNLIQEILFQKENYGILKISPKDKIKTMIEFVSPNTNKPLHIGHLRNMALGESISRISEFNGEEIIRANLNNDKGVHICKSMLAYKKWGKNAKPDKKTKPDHFVGKYYSMFGKKSKNNEKLETEAHAMLRLWEQGDNETIRLWNKMNSWAFDGWKQTFDKFGIKFDKEYYESQIYKKGKEIILEGAKKGIFQKQKDGSVKLDLKKQNLGEKYLLRSDGTSVYMTQDIYLAQLKFDQFKLDKSIYVVANEQDYHFNVLFTILSKLGFDPSKLKHLSYGMISLPEGKIKSREGTQGISVDEILDNVQDLVKKDLNKRYRLSKKELEERSLKIALAAIKYPVLKVDSKKNMVFNPKQEVSFEGDTGPYLLYSYARAKSILKKAKVKSKQLLVEELEDKETELILKLNNFKEVVQKAYQTLNPALIANYSIELSHLFNEFYHSCPVIDSKQEFFRLKLVQVFSYVLKSSLNLLGIDVLEEM